LEKLIRIKYSKTAPFKYISHLNMAQVFTRALRRADIPVVISSGFNPRFRISFGPPLPLGISSNSEYLDIRLKEEMRPGELKDRLNKVLPLGLEILKAKEIPLSSGSLIKVIDSASYMIILQQKFRKDTINLRKKDLAGKNLKTNNLKEENFGKISKDLADEINKNIKYFLSQKEIVIEKQTKKGIKSINIRPAILSMGVKEHKGPILELRLWLSIGPNENLNPRYVIESWLSKLSNFDYNLNIKQICRDGLYIKNKAVI